MHSPEGLNGPLLDALAQQEDNYKHVKFEPQWAHASPQAENVGLAVQAAMKPNVPWTGEIPVGMRPPNNNNNNDDDQVLPWDSSEIQCVYGQTVLQRSGLLPCTLKTLLTTDSYYS